MQSIEPDATICDDARAVAAYRVMREDSRFKDACLAQLFEAQAARSPDASALWCDGIDVSYQELNERANQLAHALRELGVGPAVRVGICLERSVEMAVGLLGVLKSGGTYVPLDPQYPADRLHFMLEDARPLALVTMERLRDRLGAQEIASIYLDADRSSLAQKSNANPRALATPVDIAYIMYTSGSTGRPKGVMISQRAIANRILWAQCEIPLMPGDSVFQLTSFSFDASAWEFFSPWLAGARVVLVDPARQLDSEYLVRLMIEQRITVSHFIASLLQVLVETPGLEQCTSLRVVLSGGEAVPRALPPRLLARVAVDFYQFYGPTEAAVSVTSWKYKADSGLQNLPIGKAMPGMETYVLDDEMRRVPVGVAGELYLGGVEGLAYGYFERPQLTAERFVPHPYSTHPGARLYRTGDLARYLPDGNLEFLGRVDHQVKVRGIRIETEEIEAALDRLPEVGGAVVLVREDRPGDKRLVAYLIASATLRGSEPLTARQLRQALQTELPQTMIPAAFVWLDAFPLTPNSKIDRRALPAPRWELLDDLNEQQQPATPTERALAEAWCEAFGLPQVSREANFFELGGHSLLATQLISRVRHHLKVNLPVRALFEEPTLAALAARIEALAQEEQRSRRPALRAQGQKGEAPLAYEQEQLWFLAQFDPLSPAYNTTLLLQLEGPLQLEALRDSLNDLLARHESLRTSFHERDGQPFQVVEPALTLELPLLDLSERDEQARRLGYEQACQQEANTPFDLRQAPLLRVRLVRMAPERHTLLLTTHHLIFDGLSQEIFFRELRALYLARTTGAGEPLAPLSVQYSDYARWQRGWLQGEALAEELAFWRQEVAGAATFLDLPTSVPRATAAGTSGVTRLFSLAPELTEQLKSFARQEGCTLYMLLLAGLEVLLSRYSRQEDFLLGMPVHTRQQEEAEGLIGMLVNTLVVRADVQGEPSGRQLLHRVRERLLSAQSHGDLPLEKLVEAVRPERSGGATPLIQVAFAWEEPPPAGWEFGPGLSLRVEPWASHSAKFELTFFAWETPDGIQGMLEYNSVLHDDQSMRQLIEHWRQLLHGLVSQPDCSVQRLDLLTPQERQRQIVDWNQTRRDFPVDACVHDLVEEQARAHPQAPAVSDAHQTLSYQELNERANRLAHYLREQGVGPEVRVGVCLPRSVELVVSLLAIWKAGGAYVPLDPGYPRERLTYMLSEAQAWLVISTAEQQADLPATGVRVLNLSTLSTDLTRYPDSNPAAAASATNLAYVIYTSGSTGAPKGVQVTQRNIVQLVYDPVYTAITPQDRIACASNVAFDALTFEVWAPLTRGTHLVCLNQDTILQPRALARALREHEISILFLTTALGIQVAQQEPDAFNSLRFLMLGGEAIDARAVRTALQDGAARRLLNMYGPTECTTFALFYHVDDVAEGDVTIPIGRPIGNTRAYVLDAHQQLVPPGVVGELYLGGEGLARGYLNQPALTAERFVPDPWSGQDGARLYRTGDLARAREDGALIFVGREDGQVKLRGYRIEIGEIESRLLRHPAVRAATVLLREDQPGEKQLVAYLVAQGEERPALATLRAHVREQLPEYMLPSHFVWLEQLPLTPNGKVDKRALPAPSRQLGETVGEEQRPRTELEEALAIIWSEALGGQRIGREESFFDLGGHSLLAIQLISRVRSRLRIDVPVRALFEYPTLAGFAAALPAYEATPGLANASARLYLRIHKMSPAELEAQLKAKKKKS
ncbi:non-ribosomal peptide synthetase [Dictyobacter aurantiacus]|uniref:Carrier domain-containing protein n=1 Tax=Dictyobacter aurantiacus TaxID=1936993 RepID=A0A401ZKJ1_9CHLR|nr:non-ribosomal peptide synthetase [Dictyobacter aurantiacus]GCE07387.1 hypothetical protein KDAU_47160 [Dictyobacter aurantiacus]